MKKTLFALVCALTLVLTSCWDEPGYSYTSTFLRVVTIDRNADPLKLVADYTGEVFKPGNLTAEEQLSLFGLEDADRAFATMTLEAENYNQTLTLDGASPIKVRPVWNAPLPESGKYNALVDLYRMPLDNGYYPATWLAGGRYVNIAPIIRSVGLGAYYLQPTAVYGDTLRFDMKAEYTFNDNGEGDIVDFINFDLFTLTDTAEAGAATRGVVDKMLEAIKANDSVMVMVVGDFIQSYHKVDTLADGTMKYETRDTIVKYPAIAGYSSALKWNL